MTACDPAAVGGQSINQVLSTSDGHLISIVIVVVSVASVASVGVVGSIIVQSPSVDPHSITMHCTIYDLNMHLLMQYRFH